MDLSPPLPSPPPGFRLPTLHPTGNSNSFPVIAIAVIGILATAFLLISYYIFVIKCCLTWHRVDIFNRFFSRVRDPGDESTANNAVSNDGTVATPKGLDEALIRSIPVIEFRKLDKVRHCDNDTDSDSTAAARSLRAAAAEQTVSYECAVCLSEFEEGERLRVIPYCCHAFHIDCIDIWLQSNANCPLCRSGISPDSILYNTQHLPSYPPPPANADSQHPKETPDNHVTESESEDDDGGGGYVVIEIRGNNLDEPRLVRREPLEERKKLGHVCSMGDELIDMRNKDDNEFHDIQPIRRSISMDLSNEREFCLEIQQFHRKNDDKNNDYNASDNTMEESEVSCSSGSSSSNYSKVRRSIFSFRHSRGSRCSVQPVHLDA